MKIAILTPTFSHYSGIDRVAELSAQEYAKKGNEVAVFALQADLKPKNFRLEVLGMPKGPLLSRVYRLLFFLDFWKIRNAVEKLKGYDIVISHFYPMNWIAYCAKKKYNIKYVYHNHGIGYGNLFGGFFERAYMSLFSFLNKLSLRNVDSAVSISRFLQGELKKETGLESKVVYDKIDKKRFKKGIDKSRIRKELNIKPDDLLLLFVGRISPHKNVHTLLEIFRLLREKFPNFWLLVAGKPTFPDYYRRLKSMAGKNVIFREFIEDRELPYYYAACDLYVTASLWEGFNLPIAEAQACGKKVVAFNVCSHPEVVKNGILVEKDDIEGFADAILKLLR